MVRDRSFVIAVLVLIAASLPRFAEAQGVQAAADIGQRRTVSNASLEVLAKSRDEVIKVTVVLRLGALNRNHPAVTQIDQAIRQGDVVERITSEDPVQLAAAINKFRTDVVAALAAIKKAAADNPGVASIQPLAGSLGTVETFVAASPGTPPVFAFTLSPRTVFAVGLSQAAQTGARPSFDVSTNLIGTALAAVTGGLGANNDLKNFVAKNFAVGIGFPTKSAESIQTVYSLGLGSVDIGKRTVWPVLAMQQLDTMSNEIPATIRSLHSTENTWAVPYLGFGVTLINRGDVVTRLKEGKFVPVLSIGVRLPYYYPGGVPSAFGSLFGESGKKFAGDGKPVYVVGLSIPLLRNDPEPEP